MNKSKQKELLGHFDNDLQLLQQVLYEFSRETPHLVKALTEACETENWSEVYRLSHKIYGAAANFLENPVCELAKQIEVLSQRNQTSGLLALSKHLDAQSKTLIGELTSLDFKKVAS